MKEKMRSIEIEIDELTQKIDDLVFEVLGDYKEIVMDQEEDNIKDEPIYEPML